MVQYLLISVVGGVGGVVKIRNLSLNPLECKGEIFCQKIPVGAYGSTSEDSSSFQQVHTLFVGKKEMPLQSSEGPKRGRARHIQGA